MMCEMATFLMVSYTSIAVFSVAMVVLGYLAAYVYYRHRPTGL